ncbi:MAG: hypothetical protein AAGA99_21145 [Actinomycetota bacterium]
MPGPAPKHPDQRRRRNKPDELTRLPSEGRRGRAPAWPLAGRMLAGEKDRWRELWKLPQAVMWDRLGCRSTVARYCRIVLEAEQPGARRDAITEARQLETELGLTPKAMASLKWTVVADELAERRGQRPAGERKSGTRGRVKAVDAVAGS